MENVIGILIRIALNVYIALSIRDILTLLIISVHEHEISFYLFESSLICFINVLCFSVYRASTSLAKFTPRYFILFGAIANGIVLLISLSNSSLLLF